MGGMDTWKEFARSEEIHANHLQQQLQNCNGSTALVCDISMSLSAPASLLLQVSHWEIYKCLPCSSFLASLRCHTESLKELLHSERSFAVMYAFSIDNEQCKSHSVFKLLGQEMFVASMTLWLIQL